jgi:hypothetical protein
MPCREKKIQRLTRLDVEILRLTPFPIAFRLTSENSGLALINSSDLFPELSQIVLDKRSFCRRDIDNLCSVNRPRGAALSLCTNENCITPRFTSTNNDALGKLLARLFPNVALSAAGVALLGAQISDLEKRCATMHRGIDHKRPKSRAHATAPSTAKRKI